jgi:hypothetical protein
MVRSRISATVLGLLLCAASAAAQVNVTLQLPFAQMPARVAEWRENESLIRIVVQNTGREQYEGLMLSVELSKDGRRIARSRNGHPAQPRFSLKPGETRSLSWREVINEEAVEYDGSIRQQVAATGELPEGQYRLCVQVLNAQLDLRPISPQACGSFGIVLADPPVLVSPIGGAQASPTPLLQWRPSNPPAPGLQYRVTVKVRYRGQTPAQAMASNPVRLQATVPTTSYQVPVTEQLGGDAADPNYAGHVWQVQALLNGSPYGRNSGLSQIEWFVVPAMVVDTVKDRARDTVLPKRPGEPIPPGGRPPFTPKPRPLEWEIPYEELASGRPIEFAPKTSLREGEQITLRVTVTGIQEPDRLPLPELKLMNMTPGVVRMEGGDTQTIPIRPEDISSDGTFTFTRTLSGIRPDGFSIVAFINLCPDECDKEGAVANRRHEMTFTPVGWNPRDVKKVVDLAKVLASLPGKSPFAPGGAARAIIDALPNIAMTRGFDVWVRVCCERCEKTPCWIFWSNLEWVTHCSDWQKVMTVGGLMNVGGGNWQPVDTTWDKIVKGAEDAAKKIPCP